MTTPEPAPSETRKTSPPLRRFGSRAGDRAPVSQRSFAASAGLHALVIGTLGALSFSLPGRGAGSAATAIRIARSEVKLADRFERWVEPDRELEETIVEQEPLDVVPWTDELADDAVARDPEPEQPPPAEVVWPSTRWGWRLSPRETAREAIELARPAPEPAQPEPSAGHTDPVLLQADPPSYPALARRMGWEGTVLCRICVGPDGRVLGVSVEESSGHASLDAAALEAVGGWRFRPGLRAGKATTLELCHRVTFRLDA